MVITRDLKALKTTKLYYFKDTKKRSDRNRKMRINRNKSGEGEHAYRLLIYYCFHVQASACENIRQQQRWKYSNTYGSRRSHVAQ